MICIDQLAKNSAVHAYKNYYFAFSLPLDVYVMYGIYFMGIAALSAYVFKQYQNLSAVDFFAWVMILAGAASNVAERIVLGYVRDWIYIRNGVFNFADGYIILGIVILLLNPLMTKTTKMTKLT
ncbi:MAG: signal peptidase II [Patescibacteria group bacterium]